MIVNVSSVAGRLGNATEAAYSASKFALCGWSEAIAVDLYDTPVQIRLVNPGPIDTEIWDLPGNDDPLYSGPKISAEEMAEGIVTAMESETFEHYVLSAPWWNRRPPIPSPSSRGWRPCSSAAGR